MKLKSLFLTLCLLTCPAWAESSSQQEVAKATLVAEHSAIVPGQSSSWRAKKPTENFRTAPA